MISSDTERGAGVGAGGELATQPSHGICLELFVAGVVSSPIRGDNLSEVVAASHLFEFGEPLTDHDLGCDAATGGCGEAVGNEPFDDRGHGTAVRLGPGGHVAH